MRKILVLAGFTALIATPAFAHPGHTETTFSDGLLHPLTGADHIAAMVAVGLWAAFRGGKALWMWPAAFLAGMMGGFVSGLPALEPVVLASAIILAGLALLRAKVPLWAGALLIAAFGLAHGAAHGAETSGAAAAAGFMLSTAGLHALGLGFGLGLTRLVPAKARA